MSILLADWAEDVFLEFGLSTDDFITATSDAGNDVKVMLESCLGIQREWCIAHIINLALVEAFTKEPLARSLVNDMKRVVRHLKRSPKAITVLKDFERQMGFQCTPTLFANQRWASSARMFDFFRKHEESLRRYFNDSDKHPFKWPPTIETVILQEVSSLLRTVKKILK